MIWFHDKELQSFSAVLVILGEGSLFHFQILNTLKA